MKKFILLVLFAVFAFQVNASVVVRSNIVAYSDDATIAESILTGTELEKQENPISKTIENLKASLTKPIDKIKNNLTTETRETITETRDVITDETGKTEITESKEIITLNKGETKVLKTQSKEIIMEAKPIAEVKKEQKNHETFVVLKTEKGDIKIKLYMDKAPITAGNFLDLAKKKFYNGLTFHRLISGFMIQGGCPLGTGTGNYVDPTTKQPRYIKHETHPELKHDKEGVVAMARTSDPNTASSQFFIDLGPQPFLNAGGADPYGYAVFGQVVEGMAVVHKIMKENVAPYPGSDGTSNPVKIVTTEVIE